MTVTGIEEINNKKCRIYIDGYFKLVLYKGEIRKLNLKHNSEIDEEVYYYIIKDILVKRARLRALHILEKREYTKKQLTDKLKQNEYPDIVIEDAIDYVESYNYINDERYAMQYFRCGCKKKSVRRLQLELGKKGIDKDTVQNAYEKIKYEIDVDYEKDRLISKLIDKRFRNLDTVTDKDIQKTYRYLMSKGFNFDDISRYMKQLNID